MIEFIGKFYLKIIDYQPPITTFEMSKLVSFAKTPI